jgi:hypothetical protein
MKTNKLPNKDGFYLYRPAKRPKAKPIVVRVEHWSNGEFYFTTICEQDCDCSPKWAIGCIGGFFEGPFKALQ